MIFPWHCRYGSGSLIHNARFEIHMAEWKQESTCLEINEALKIYFRIRAIMHLLRELFYISAFV
jgi:hypothetical protein